MSRARLFGISHLVPTILILGVFLAGWTQPGFAATTAEPAVQNVAAGANALGMSLLPELSKLLPGNLFFSPFSIHVAFAMPFSGADGATREEMIKAFGYPVKGKGLSPDFGAYLKSFPGFGGTPAATEYEFALANAIWGQKKYPFDPAYLAFVQTVFASELHTVDFGAEAEKIRLDINGWVEKLTHDKIKDLIPPDALDALTRMVLVNAVYFKGKWASQFPKEATQDAPFFVDGKDEITVPTMRQTADFRYAENGKCQTLRLPYRGGDLAMYVFLPSERTGLPELEKALAEKPLADWTALDGEEKVTVSLPRFRMETGFPLPGALQALGVVQAFSEKSADFSKMLDPVKGKSEPGLFISAAFHKAFVAVDEEGTEAAAATAVVMSRKSMPEPPKKFTADHPFLFCIVHEPTSAVLFLGRVTNPK